MFRPVSALVLAVFLSPVAASAQQGYTWAYDRDVSPNVFETNLSLRYGVPETDDIQMFAECGIGASEPLVRVTLGAPIGNLPKGTGVQISFSGRGYSQTIEAAVVRHDEFLYGVDFVVSPTDRFIAALAGQNSLTYAVVGQPAATLSLRGSAGPVRAFAADCANIGDLSQAVAPQGKDPTGASATPRPGDFGCNLFGSLASQNSDVPQHANFVNHTDGYRVLMWLDFSGQPVEYARLNPGDSASIDSFLTHPWMVTDGPGNCIQIFELQQGVTQYDITAPSPNFGDE